MRATTHPPSEPGFITLCIQMAQSTFSDVMPSEADSKSNSPPAGAPAGRSAQNPTLFSRLDDCFYRQQLKAREAYLATATDIFDLEARIRHLERGPYFKE
ncbi:MAG: DUF3563 family protein [Betaproteobacteria bacterium]